MACKYNYAIYFSTHSIELISNIEPSNIFFIERHADNSIEVINPCYPAYATRILYDHNGYDKVILVEDELAKSIIDKLLRKEQLLNSKLVHVLPCGGYTNVIDLANDVVRFNILGRMASISIILDGDVEEKAKNYMISHSIKNNIALNFLPIESLEKYLKNKLYSDVDQKLFRRLQDYVFQNRSLTELIDEYKKSKPENDNDGKKLFKILDKELKERRVSREEMISNIVNYLFENNDESLEQLTDFLKKQMAN